MLKMQVIAHQAHGLGIGKGLSQPGPERTGLMRGVKEGAAAGSADVVVHAQEQAKAMPA
jgi:hypothetical protein